jgi:ABC-type transporter MlaC component
MIRKIYLLIFLTAIYSACAAESPESRQVKGVIMQYNALLAEGYKKMNMNPLQLVATEAVATKAYYHMAALGEGKVRMVSVLKEMKFKDVKFPFPGTATVTTREIWDFTHYDIASGKKVLEEKGYPYEMTFELKKDAGQWKISNVLAMGEERSVAARPESTGAK